MASARAGTLHARLALWYAGVITLVLVGFAAAVYSFAVVEPDDGDDPTEVHERAVARGHVLMTLALALPGAILVAVGGGVWITRRSLAPLAEILEVCRALRISDLRRRVISPARTTHEIDELASSLNAMLERLDLSVEGLRRFTADASHELRTPLTRVTSQLELALARHTDGRADARATGDALAAALDELSGMARLVEALLTLARSDAGELVQARAPVDVSALVRDVALPYEAVAAERGLALSLRADAPHYARGDIECLRRAVANLVDNACKFTPSGGTVTVHVSASGGRVSVHVVDSGPGIAPAERERVFERFYRVEATRGIPGSGLGLALCREVVRAHGGDVTLATAAATGAAFVIDLPAG